jgi:hypothetical protein
MLTITISPSCPPFLAPPPHRRGVRPTVFYQAHRESEEFFRLTGQLAQPNQDYVTSKRAAFFNGLKDKVGHIMAKAMALRLNLNLAPSVALRASGTHP